MQARLDRLTDGTSGWTGRQTAETGGGGGGGRLLIVLPRVCAGNLISFPRYGTEPRKQFQAQVSVSRGRV